MELRHVYGRTYAAVGATALMPVYKLTDTDIVLMERAMPDWTAAPW